MMHRLLVLLLFLPCLVFQVTTAQENSIEERLQSLETAAETALSRQAEGAKQYSSLVNELSQVMQESRELRALEQELVRRTLALESLIQQANAVQLQHVAWHLNKTLEEALTERREQPVEKEQEDIELDMDSVVTISELNEHTEASRFMEKSETRLLEWTKEVVRDEVQSFRKQAVTGGGGSKCTTPIQAAQLVQSSLMTYATDGIGMMDQALGGSIVHELTSDTYVPPSQETLGESRLRRYIPQDWERMLPSDWQEWSAQMPPFIAHSLGLQSDCQPPEAILTTTTHAGSCWPMKGKQGQVTIRLPRSILVEAVTLDHAALFMNSAPKLFRVIAYPPCNTCQGLGFDTKRAWEMGVFEFDKGTSVQTFDVMSAKEDAGGSCSQEEPSCDAELDPVKHIHVPPKKDTAVAAITLEILDNWGEPDYTCLYRFRVHGNVQE